MVEQTHRDSGNFVKVARLLVYMCPPTSMCTGALDLVSCAGVGMPWLLNGDTGDLVIMGLDMLERLSCKTRRKYIYIKEENTQRKHTEKKTKKMDYDNQDSKHVNLNISVLQHTPQSGVSAKIVLLCQIEQPDLDLNVATIHKHPLLWAIISKTKLIWSINLRVLEMSNNDSLIWIP